MLNTLPVPIDPPVHENLEASKHTTGLENEAGDDTVAGVVYTIATPIFPRSQWVLVVCTVVDYIVRYHSVVWPRVIANPSKEVDSDLEFVDTAAVLRLC